jgi:hypothetical protein
VYLSTLIIAIAFVGASLAVAASVAEADSWDAEVIFLEMTKSECVGTAKTRRLQYSLIGKQRRPRILLAKHLLSASKTRSVDTVYS